MASREDADALRVVEFWLNAGPARWFAKSDDFDARCRDFVDLREKAIAGDLDGWRETAAGSLALIVLLDQIPRNAFRGPAEQFASDPLALEVALAALDNGHDRAYAMPARMLFYLPLEHAEDLAMQLKCVDLVRATGNQEFHYWALVHADAIHRFGRFPHRNAMLGRTTSPDEEAYLKSGGFGA